MSQQPPYPPDGPGWGQAPDPGQAGGWGQPAPAPAPAPGWDPTAQQAYPQQGYPQQGYPPQPGYPPQGPAGPGYGGPPGYGPPGGPGAPKKRSPLVPILIVLVLVGAAIGGWFLLAGGGDDDSPEDAVRGWFDALIDGDCNGAIDHMALGDTDRATALAECEDMVELTGLGGGDVADDVADSLPEEIVSVETTDESDDSATVEVEVRLRDGSTETEDMQVVKEDGEWKVDASGILSGVPDVGDLPDTPGDEPDEPTDTTADEPDEPSGDLTEPPIDDAEAIENPELIPMAEDCGAGDMAQCDALWGATEFGGALEAYAETCGGLAPEGGYSGDCELTFG